MKSITAFITGHRTVNFKLAKLGINQLTDLAIQRRFTIFLTGMALGTDQLAAEIWTERYLTWKAILPCEDQSNLWPLPKQIHYRKLLGKASEIQVLYPQYKQGVMQARNLFMVRNSQLGLAVWNNGCQQGLGGTFLTIQMARKAKLPLIIFNPQTQQITFEPQHYQLTLDL
ncbi:SLOG family protein [Lyngbya sp. PCC 8106]|uniref:SLOG family protein n=1 Tax=Lyngbya sp. (strain PCC 8106) TaxID=313612 RepID=UPI0000EABA00|nr:SLOG family protein [Lyngbya sp. PCC 8106]EAW33346.1 hypothetical protein L8106_22791 [Lyngbya sp. PCC 8106]